MQGQHGTSPNCKLLYYDLFPALSLVWYLSARISWESADMCILNIFVMVPALNLLWH